MTDDLEVDFKEETAPPPGAASGIKTQIALCCTCTHLNHSQGTESNWLLLYCQFHTFMYLWAVCWALTNIKNSKWHQIVHIGPLTWILWNLDIWTWSLVQRRYFSEQRALPDDGRLALCCCPHSLLNILLVFRADSRVASHLCQAHLCRQGIFITGVSHLPSGTSREPTKWPFVSLCHHSHLDATSFASCSCWLDEGLQLSSSGPVA